MKAKLRNDLKGQTPPFESLLPKKRVIDWSKAYECWQPEELDNYEFNLMLNIDGEYVVFANSIDFEFIN